MTTDSKTNNDDLMVQEHCIDLPGESVQCWIGGDTDKLKVILRKHRDVIFEIHVSNGKSYTLESTESDFYNPRDKKLVYANRHDKVAFKDGERFHIWISRDFHGSLCSSQTSASYIRLSPASGTCKNTATIPKKNRLQS